MGFIEKEIKFSRKEKEMLRRSKEFIKKYKLNIFEIEYIDFITYCNIMERRGY